MKNNEVFIITSVSEALAKNNSNYAVLSIQNLKESLTINVWGSPKSFFKVGKCVSCDSFQESNSFYSCKFSDIHQFDCTSNELANIIPHPVSFEHWQTVVDEVTILIRSTDQKKIFNDACKKLYPIYVTKVAARSNHHAFIGGLLQHTYEMLKMYVALCNETPFVTHPFIVAMGVLFHDYGKIMEYDSSANLTEHFFIEGHPYLGAKAVYAFLKQYPELDERLIEHVEHCVLAHHSRKEWGSPVVPSTPEAFMVAQLDLLSGWGVMFNVPSNTSCKSLQTNIFHYDKPTV